MQCVNEIQLEKLKEKEGIIFKNVHGKQVALCDEKEFQYRNIYDFIVDYIRDYGIDNFAKNTGYEDAQDLIECWVQLPLTQYDLKDCCINSFEGRYPWEMED